MPSEMWHEYYEWFHCLLCFMQINYHEYCTWFPLSFRGKVIFMACFGIIFYLQATVSTGMKNVFSPISGTDKEYARILIGDYIWTTSVTETERAWFGLWARGKNNITLPVPTTKVVLSRHFYCPHLVSFAFWQSMWWTQMQLKAG